MRFNNNNLKITKIKEIKKGTQARIYIVKSPYYHHNKKKFIQKSYPMWKKDQYFWEKEVYLKLQRQSCHFIPELFGFNDKNYTLYLKYIGSPPPKNKTNKNIVRNYLTILHQVYHLSRSNEIPFKWDNVLYSKKRDQIYLIDFGYHRNWKWN